MDGINLKRIEYGSKEYKEELELRNDILRLPLGLDIYDDDLKSEEGDIHLGAFIDGALAGVLVLSAAEEGVIRMRQVAVHEAFQGKGIGKSLTEYAEKLMREKGYREMRLRARSTAVKFYERLGYSAIGDVFIEIGIPHVEMKKLL